MELSIQMGYSYSDTRGASSHALDEFSKNRQALQPMTSRILAPSQWKKLNQLVDNLPFPSIIQELRNVFFSEANWYFSAIDQFYFDQAYREWAQCWDTSLTAVEQHGTAESLCFPALLFQILALAMQFVPPGSAVEETTRTMNAPSLDELSKHFSDTAERILNTLGRHIQAITAVQADLMRCAWLKTCGRGSEAWYSLGNAVRQAQDQRLHLEPRPWQTADQSEDLRQAWYNEHRRRLWACLFTWESHMALQLGRPRMLNAGDCTIKSPIDIDIPEHPSRTLSSPAASDEKPSHYTSQRVKFYLAQLIDKLMSLGAFKPGFTDYSTIQSIHAEVDHLLDSLPLAMRPDRPDGSWDLQYPDISKHRLQISIVANSFLALHKPHAAQYPQSLELAVSAAIEVLDKTQLLFEKTEEHQYKIYTLVFYTIDAGLLLSAMMAKFPLEMRMLKEHAVPALQQAVIRLSILKSRNLAAVAGEKALAQCLQELGYTSENMHTEHERFEREPEHSATDQSEEIAQQNFPSTPQNAHEEGLIRTVVREEPSITPAGNLPSAHPTFDFKQSVMNGPDLFTQIMDDDAWTASWLEQMNSISSMNFDLEEDSFEWNKGFPPALSTPR